MLDIEKAVHYIRLLNSDVALMASDYVLHQCFPSGELHFDHRSVTNQVILVDRLWNAGLRFTPDAAGTITEQLVIHAENIYANLSNLQPDDLNNSPENICNVAQEIFPVILEAPGRQNYSFTTKFFHWCTRKHFPIVDLHARKAISRLQADEHCADDEIVENIDDANLPIIEKYSGWINFYNRLLNELTPEACDRLLNADQESQQETCPSFTIMNSLLRILDKVFYMNRGKETLSRNLQN